MVVHARVSSQRVRTSAREIELETRARPYEFQGAGGRGASAAAASAAAVLVRVAALTKEKCNLADSLADMRRALVAADNVLAAESELRSARVAERAEADSARSCPCTTVF